MLEKLNFAIMSEIKKNEEKIRELLTILHYCKDTCKMIFYEKDYLIDIDKEFYNESSSD